MMNMEKMYAENGGFEKEGRTYILVQQAYIDRDSRTGRDYYRALAICKDEQDEAGWKPLYEVEYGILESYDAEIMEEDQACDWSQPEEVRETDAEYHMEDGRIA